MGRPTKIEILVEANKRMNILSKMGYRKEAVSAFFDDGLVFISDSQPTVVNGEQRQSGSVYSLEEFEEYDKTTCDAIRWFEQEFGGYVYAAIFNLTNLGRMVSILYVSEYSDDWERDRTDLRNGNPFVYVANLDDLSLNDFGFIQVACFQGRLVRL